MALNVTRRINCQEPGWIQERLDKQELEPLQSRLNTKKTSRRTRELMVDRLYGAVMRDQMKNRESREADESKSIERQRERCWGTADTPPVASPPRVSSASQRSHVSARGVALHRAGIMSRNERWIDEEQRRIEAELCPQPVAMRGSRGSIESSRKASSRSFDNSEGSPGGTRSYRTADKTDDEVPDNASDGDGSASPATVGFDPVPLTPKPKKVHQPVAAPPDGEASHDVQDEVPQKEESPPSEPSEEVPPAVDNEAGGDPPTEHDQPTHHTADDTKTDGDNVQSVASPQVTDAHDDVNDNGDDTARDATYDPHEASYEIERITSVADDTREEGRPVLPEAEINDAKSEGSSSSSSSSVDSDEEIERLLRRAKQAAGVDS